MNSELKIIKLVLAKNDAYLLYFLLEATEGICFYSTLPANPAQPGLATIELKFHPSTSDDVHKLLSSIRKQSLMSFEMIEG